MDDPIARADSPAKGGAPWLSIIGIAEDGALSPAARGALEAAQAVFGSPRHLALAGLEGDVRACVWPVPFSTAPVLELAGQRVAVLASGDPFWHGAGGTLTQDLTPDAWQAFPAASTFSLAAARMGWRLEETLCLGLHAAPFARLRPLLAPGMQAICLLRDGDAPTALAAWLENHGWGATQITVLSRLGGGRERVHRALAHDLSGRFEAPVAVALNVAGASGLSRASGLPDAVFAHEGQITKRPVRALSLSALAPRPADHLWDIGAGTGSISVEFLLAAPASTATLIEPRADRRALIQENLAAFGLDHRARIISDAAPAALADLDAPQVIFLGGGAGTDTLNTAWGALRSGGRMVANAVTLETEALLADAHTRFGGTLLRIALEEATALGQMRGWQPARTITQWSVTK